MVARSGTIPTAMDVDGMDTDELKDTLKKIIQELNEAQEEKASKVPVPSAPDKPGEDDEEKHGEEGEEEEEENKDNMGNQGIKESITNFNSKNINKPIPWDGENVIPVLEADPLI